ncbi:MAG: hypothetical protein SPK23_01380 [Eubacteriales bacterium]|nr:hypothetical protein [Eubacteriales bacterium]
MPMSKQEKLKLLTGIDNEDLLSYALDQAEGRLLTLVNNRAEHYGLKTYDSVPGELGFITLEVAVKRIRRLGSEGLVGESVEGHRRDFQVATHDFDEFLPEINDFLAGVIPYKDAGGLFIW